MWGSSQPRRNQAMEPVTNRQLRKEPPGERPGGSFYCGPPLLGCETRPFTEGHLRLIIPTENIETSFAGESTRK
jgi:hypothetical protein